MELKNRKCVPIASGTKPLGKDQIDHLIKMLPPDWTLIENKVIKKKFPFENFKKGMTSAQVFSLMAEKENHHPERSDAYQHVEIILNTQVIGGLTEDDFIMAAKFENI
jgi:4a-hydroxytetrahydrobiopterin dehydratase